MAVAAFVAVAAVAAFVAAAAVRPVDLAVEPSQLPAVVELAAVAAERRIRLVVVHANEAFAAPAQA